MHGELTLHEYATYKTLLYFHAVIMTDKHLSASFAQLPLHLKYQSVKITTLNYIYQLYISIAIACRVDTCIERQKYH